jgi:predicted Zn finger-like uncharacterized protein
MDVRCERCKAEYHLDDDRVTETGVTLRCTQCQHVFLVKKKSVVVTVPVKPSPEVVPAAGAAETPREWRLRQASGGTITFRELTSLQKWIVERKVARDDEISADGERWRRLGDIAELESFFRVVEEAQRGAAPPPQPPPPQPPVPQPPSPGEVQRVAALQALQASPAASSPVAPTPRRKGSGLLVFGLGALLLGLLAWLGYSQVLLPREQEAARVQEEARLTALRLEQERQALEARANAEPVVPPVEALPDAGESALLAGGALLDGGAEDGGLALVDAGADAGEALAEAADAGPLLAEALPDAGLAPEGTDAGVGEGALAVVDAGTPDGGSALQGKRREPVLDFDGYLAQGDRLRDRNRPQAALASYDKAVALEPERAEPYAGRGLALLDLGSPGQAEADFKRALELNPRYGVALMGLAETYRTQGRKAEAIRYYERYLDVLPNGPEAAVARSAIERLKE